MGDKQFRNFFSWVLFLPVLPYAGFAINFPPETIGSYNVAGIAWVIMYMVAIYYYFANKGQSSFPLIYWVPWVAFLGLYLLVDFSFPGLQLTLQYIIPFFVAIVASRFEYTEERLDWLFKRLYMATGVIVGTFFFGTYFLDGLTPMTAITPMFLSIVAALTIGLFYQTRKILYIMLFMGLLLVPLIDVTRMGIAVMIFIFIFHFANKDIVSKVIYGAIGVLIIIFVFNSAGFQEKTFYGKGGKISDVSLNYYKPDDRMNTSGRSIFLKYYEQGLNKSPILGNGPRSDLYVLKGVVDGSGISEAHNDYIAVRYNYGFVGLALLIMGFIGTFVDVSVRYYKETDGYNKLLLSSIMTLTLTFLIYMYSDNILKSTLFFTNIYFVLIGIAYARLKKNSLE
jgi:hypothetical protein